MSERFDLLVVGAGPCGIAVGAAAQKAGLSCALFDKGCITASLVNYPYYMTFFSTARMLEIGDVPFTIPTDKPTRRDALAYYRFVVRHWEIDVRQYEAVLEITGSEGDFTVQTRKADGSEGTYRTDAVVVAIGGFHKPNLLDVEGEDLPKVLRAGDVPERRARHPGALPRQDRPGRETVGGARHRQSTEERGDLRLLEAPAP
jgi:thioredoxin reductase (NADPH)